MSTSPYDLCVFIGRFAPLHVGHVRVMQEGLRLAPHLMVCVGSAHAARCPRTPFTANERAGLITHTLGTDRVHVLPIEDSLDDAQAWARSVTEAVLQHWHVLRGQDASLPEMPRVGLLGYTKDATSFYLDDFPDWTRVPLPATHLLSATDMRANLFGSRRIWEALFMQREARAVDEGRFLQQAYTLAQREARQFLEQQKTLGHTQASDLPLNVTTWLNTFLGTSSYMTLVYETAAAAYTQWQWRNSPYAPIFVTADAVVEHEGHILMLQRNTYPGKGLWAVPGGFVEQDERVLETALRELDEETGLDLPREVLRQYVKGSFVSDVPWRSSRGRTITHAFYIKLPDGPRPAVKHLTSVTEEAMHLAWVPLQTLRRDQCFEDHYVLIHRSLQESAYTSLQKAGASEVAPLDSEATPPSSPLSTPSSVSFMTSHQTSLPSTRVFSEKQTAAVVPLSLFTLGQALSGL